MFKVTKEMLDSARTKNGSFTNTQIRIMTAIFSNDWKNSLLACNDFCPKVWTRFKAANITANEARRAKGNKRSSSKVNAIENGIERSKDSKPKTKTSTETVSDLKDKAGCIALEIYKTIPSEQLEALPAAVKKAWMVGMYIDKQLKLLNRGQ